MCGRHPRVAAPYVLGAIGAAVVSCCPFHPGLTAQTVFTVNTTSDTDDGACSASHCTLREAINAANLAADGAVIAFDIPGPGPHTIRPTSNLPFLLGRIVVDGTTQSDFAGTPVIELDGTNAGSFAQGLNVADSGNVIRGLVVNRFSDVGISIGSGAHYNRVEGCYVGTDPSGSVARGNANSGVLIGQAWNNTVGGTTAAARNVISGNPDGVTIFDTTATANVVLGNYIGTDATGTVALPNHTGVALLAPGNTIGGLEPGAGNVIAGNTGNGVGLGPPIATGNVILGNYIGVDATGNAALGNDVGVFLNDVPDNTVGGTTPGAGNVVSGNREGITLWEVGATGNRIQGNFVGTNAVGDAALPNDEGVVVYSAGNTVGGTEAGAGNLVSGNLNNGVDFFGENATGNTVQGNWIGTDVTGTVALGNGESGISIQGGATDNLIGGTEEGARNLLSGNKFGILIGDPAATDNRIQGNYIGTDFSGTTAVPNAQTGILLWARHTVVGGAESGAGNVISGNVFAGIDMGGGSGDVVIQGNYIGTDASGTMALGNDLGIFVNFSDHDTIGGVDTGARNVISGNTGGSITINGVDAMGNVLRGNYIGTDATGTAALGNGRGIQILDAPGNVVGGTAAGARNVISANLNGVLLDGPNASGNVIQGNYFGTDASGANPMGNRGATIRFSNGAANNSVGGTEAGAGNVVANSGWHGITLFQDAGTGNAIRSNSVFDNGSLGIELGRDGVSENDEGDSDTGPNDLQNYPSLTAVMAGGGAAIQATLHSAPSSSYDLDFFSDLACDESGYGEGRTPLGTASLTTDASGVGTATASFSGVGGTVVTATATDASGNTSEFSKCAVLAALAVSPSPASRTVAAGASAVYTIAVAVSDTAFEGAVDLACSGNPTGTACTFEEDGPTLASGQASTTMTVTTVAPASSPPSSTGRTPIGPWLLWLAALGALAVAGKVAREEALGRPHPTVRPSVPRVVGQAALGAIILAAAASCGNDGTSIPSGGTPPGSYELTVTASWESVQASTTVTMVVQ